MCWLTWGKQNVFLGLVNYSGGKYYITLETTYLSRWNKCNFYAKMHAYLNFIPHIRQNIVMAYISIIYCGFKRPQPFGEENTYHKTVIQYYFQGKKG